MKPYLVIPEKFKRAAVRFEPHRMAVRCHRLSVEVKRMGYFSELVRAREIQLEQMARYRVKKKTKK